METKNRQGLCTVAAAIAIQLSLGIAYLWSLFQTGIANSLFGGDNAAAGLTFSLLLATLTLGSIAGGKLAAKYTTRVVVIIGGLILSAGFFLASFVTAQYAWALWLTYGVMGGVGMGFTYSTTIALAQKWFPSKKGLVTGIIVSALGFGGVVFTPVIESLIKTFGGAGVGEPKTFMVLSAIFLVICTTGGLFMKNPPAAVDGVPLAGMSTLEMLKSPQFYLITATFCLGSMGGLMMIGFAKPIAVAKGLADTATVGVLAISLFNSFGRLVWGFVSDKIGRINTVIILLVCTAIFSLLVDSVNGYFIYLLIGLIGFFYGGLLSTFPSLTADLFGAKNMATNYGFVLLGFGAGAILSSQVAGYYKNLAAEDISLMFPAFVIASVCAVVAMLLMLVLKRKTA